MCVGTVGGEEEGGAGACIPEICSSLACSTADSLSCLPWPSTFSWTQSTPASKRTVSACDIAVIWE